VNLLSTPLGRPGPGAAALEGKGMIVCMSWRICVALYNAIVKLRPDWHSDEDDAGAIKAVMSRRCA
jgi:type I restriction enzyme, R subunit